ncbi:MAG: hypothetical protein V8Q23_03775 [Eubacteriales bacterium]
MRKAYYVACGLVYELMFLAVPAHGERVCSDCDRCADRVFCSRVAWHARLRFVRSKYSLLWLGTVLAAHLLADWLSLPLYIARLCDVEIQESGALSAADGLLVWMVMAVFAMGSLSVYAVSLGLTVRRRSKQAA